LDFLFLGYPHSIIRFYPGEMAVNHFLEFKGLKTEDAFTFTVQPGVIIIEKNGRQRVRNIITHLVLLTPKGEA